MKALALSAMLFAAVLPVLAQTPEPPAPPPPPRAEPKAPFRQSVFVGGGVAAGFGTVDFVELSPLVGFHVVPRFDLGFQPFYRWMNDDRSSPSVSTTDYGAGVFARVRIVQGLFGEVDYQYSSYEYANGNGGTTRATHNAYLAGAGYTVPVGHNVGFYTSALYDFTYNDLDSPYDSPVRFQVGVSVGF